MAACSGNGNMMKSSAGTTSGHGGHGGMTMAGSGGAGMGGHGGEPEDSGIFDALTDPVSDAIASPGTRLKGKFYLSDDGAKEYQYVPEVILGNSNGVHQLWYDSQRQEDCIFGTADDGKIRCMPTDTVYWDGAYADAQCTVGMVLVAVPPIQCNFTAPKYAILTTYDTCGSSPPTKKVYSLGQQLNLQSMPPVYRMQNGTCTYMGNTGSNGPWFKVGAQVQSSSFAAATPMIDP
jgi:hypothetical protein